MKITRRNIITGKVGEMDLDVTAEEMSAFIKGEYVQRAFPRLNAGEREFMLNGILPEDWDEMFPEEDE